MFTKRAFLALAAQAVVATCLATGVAYAEPLQKPAKRVLLEVSGAIKEHNKGDMAEFDLPMLEKLGGAKLTTSTAWTDGTPTFEGVQISKLMERVGATGKTVVAVALNDYKVEIPVDDFTRYPVILAYKMNGEYLKIRDKGPLWIIYPQDEFPALKTKQTQAKWVWQVKALQFK